MKNIEFKIDGMSCGGCAWWMSRAFEETKWINSVDVSHETKLAKIEYDESILSENDIFEIVKNKNYIPSNI